MGRSPRRLSDRPSRPQENGARGSRESGPPEDRYKGSRPFLFWRAAPGTERPMRYYVGVDWADTSHAVWTVDATGGR